MSAPDASIPESHKLIVRGIEAVEASKNGLHNVEKSLDELKAEVTRLASLASGTEGTLRRIAAVEEQRALDERRMTESRDAWLAKLWDSKPVQYGLILVVIGLSQFFGIQWMTQGSHAPFAVEAPRMNEAAP